MALVVEHHEELETDLLGQGHDLLDFWRGRITPRRMRVLISNLPAQGRTFRTVDPRAAYEASWGAGEHLFAAFLDMWLHMHSDGQAGPFPRPGEQWDQVVRQQQVKAFLLAQAERNKQRDAEQANVTYLDERR